MTNDIQKAYQNIDNSPSKPFTNEQIRELLTNYDNNREGVKTILLNLQSEAEKELFPSSTNLEHDRVQKSLFELYQTAKSRYAAAPEEAQKMATDPLGPLPEGASAAELAAWTLVGNVLLNLDEALNR